VKREVKEKIGKFILRAAENDLRRHMKQVKAKGNYFAPYERVVLECLAAYLRAKNDPEITIRGLMAAYWIGEDTEIHRTAGKYYLPKLEKMAKEQQGGKRHVLRNRTRRKATGAQQR
jgi:hypothetical protein